MTVLGVAPAVSTQSLISLHTKGCPKVLPPLPAQKGRPQPTLPARMPYMCQRTLSSPNSSGLSNPTPTNSVHHGATCLRPRVRTPCSPFRSSVTPSGETFPRFLLHLLPTEPPEHSGSTADSSQYLSLYCGPSIGDSEEAATPP